MSTFSFQNPETLWLIPIAVAALAFLIRANLVKFRDSTEKRNFLQEKKGIRIIIFFTRALVITALLLALANPLILQTRTIESNPSLQIFVDQSDSYSLFDTAVLEELTAALRKDVPVSVRTIASGNSSRIGDGLLNNMQGDDSILLVSDGHNTHGRSLGDMLFFAAQLNSTINLLELEPVLGDAVVSVEGPAETTRGVATDFLVNVDAAGELPEYELSVTVDGDALISETHHGSVTVPFETRFAEGYHRIVARISVQDHFAENNIYYKSVKVEPKPKVLFVTGSDSPLEDIYSELYELSTVSSFPGSLDGYSAVVLNNLPASAVPMDNLVPYVTDGNGLVVIGGTNAYDRGGYKNSLLESFLPVSVGTGVEAEARKDVNVVLLIDISGSSGKIGDTRTGATVEDLEKALALQILDDLSPQSKVAVVAFNTQAYTVANLYPLSQQATLRDDIARLKFSGGTLIDEALAAGRDMLASTEGSKSIILLSDGLGGTPGEELRQVRLAAVRGIKVYTVGVGPHTDTAHMQELASLGNGIYFEPSAAERIRLLLGEPKPEEEDIFRLEVIDGGDFVTRSLRLNAVVSGFNFVVPKLAAKQLVSTSQGQPIVTSWRFGLGRIVAFSTDDGSKWSGQVLARENSALHSRMVNWAVGDLSRNKEFDVKMRDNYLGEPIDIHVISQARPSHPELSFVQLDEKLYRTTVIPETTGFQQYVTGVVAVNYPLELAQVGINPELKRIVSLTSGKVFTPDQAEEIAEKVLQDSRKVQSVPTSLQRWLLAAALLIFLAEVFVRKLGENRNINK